MQKISMPILHTQSDTSFCFMVLACIFKSVLKGFVKYWYALNLVKELHHDSSRRAILYRSVYKNTHWFPTAIN